MTVFIDPARSNSKTATKDRKRHRKPADAHLTAMEWVNVIRGLLFAAATFLAAVTAFVAQVIKH